jgi:hypothetical protein
MEWVRLSHNYYYAAGAGTHEQYMSCHLLMTTLFVLSLSLPHSSFYNHRIVHRSPPLQLGEEYMLY